MKTEAPATPVHSMRSAPPRVWTSTGEASQPRRMPATTAAQAPVPQAKVSPEPRSNTRRRTWCGVCTCKNPALTRCGKAGWCSISGPWLATGAVSTSSTRCTAWGFPMETTSMATVSPPGNAKRQWSPSGWACSGKKGMRAGSKAGAPMSTCTRPSASSRNSSWPCLTCTRTGLRVVKPCSCT